ncbi:hypothetical protein HYW39_01345 [Candidatus Curtissbacteria bacterium]|nr:hypothetical protein [Candidatus Curtissbacteria bacterium]
MGGKLTEKYSNLPKEARIATLKDYFSFIAMHELRHVLQAVRNPEKWNELDRKKVALSRTILGITASSPIALTSEMAALGWAGATFGLIGFHAVLRPLPDLEKDPEDAVKEADLEKIKRRPFNIEIETDPQPQI